VRNIDISDNRVFNLDGFGISQNSNSTLANVRISNNQIFNTTGGLHVSGAQTTGNSIVDTQAFQSFESSDSIGALYRGSVQCSAQGTVERRCGQDSRFGQCAAVLQLGQADCSGAIAQLTGPGISVSAGQRVISDGWVSNPVGRWCVRFNDASGNQLSQQCDNLTNSGTSDVQSFVGLPTLEASAPEGSASAQLRIYHQQVGQTMVLDDLKVSVGR